jgi:hypothetical protein
VKLLKEPEIDKDEWVQYCIRSPFNLGKDRLFIELNVDWTEWTEKDELVKALNVKVKK